MLCRRSARRQASCARPERVLSRYNRMAGTRHAPKIGSCEKSTTYYSGRAASRGAMVRRTPTNRLWLRTTAFPPLEAARSRGFIAGLACVHPASRVARVASPRERRVVRAASHRLNNRACTHRGTGISRALGSSCILPMFHAVRCSPGPCYAIIAHAKAEGRPVT